MEPKTPTVQDLYPQLTEAERAIAEENLDRYLALVLRIFERLETEAQEGRPIDAPNGNDTLLSSP